MKLTRISGLALAAVVAGPLVGCGGSGAASDAAVEAGMPLGEPDDLLSDFTQDDAIVLPLGSPARNGYWYAYNDAAASCLQSPAHAEPYYPSTPPLGAPGASAGRALHAAWTGCGVWGAGVGADLAVPPGSAMGAGPRVTYDLTPFTGIAFWAMAAPGTATQVRTKLVMRASTQIQDRGVCDESVLGPDRCGDEWGKLVTLPSDGSWAAVTVRFSDAGFAQEGWGQAFAWNPADVFGIQFQSAASGGLYDFWIDDIYLVR